MDWSRLLELGVADFSGNQEVCDPIGFGSSVHFGLDLE
jgi:hypothetical protein